METKQTVGIGIIGMGWMGMMPARAYRYLSSVRALAINPRARCVE